MDDVTDTPSKTPESPYQDAKEMKDAFKDAFRKTDTFTQHSTNRVIGPLATRALKGVSAVWHYIWTPKG